MPTPKSPPLRAAALRLPIGFHHLGLAYMLSACGGGSVAPVPGGSGPQAVVPVAAAAGPAAEGSGKAKGKGKGKGKSGGKADHKAGERYRPLGKGMCTPDCRLLTAYTFDEVIEHYCTLCGAHDDMACVMDWPANDVPGCEIWDYYRNCIYATYGRPFEHKQWQDAFGKQPWYQVDPGYTDAKLSPTAKINVDDAQRRKANKVMCGP